MGSCSGHCRRCTTDGGCCGKRDCCGESPEAEPLVPQRVITSQPAVLDVKYEAKEMARWMRTSEEEGKSRVTDAVLEGQPQLTVTIRKAPEAPLGVEWSLGAPQKLAAVGAVLGGSPADRHGFALLRGWLLAAVGGTAVEGQAETQAVGMGRSEVSLTLLAPPPDSPVIAWQRESSCDSTESVALLIGDCVLVGDRRAWVVDVTPSGAPQVQFDSGQREWLLARVGSAATTGRCSPSKCTGATTSMCPTAATTPRRASANSPCPFNFSVTSKPSVNASVFDSGTNITWWASPFQASPLQPSVSAMEVDELRSPPFVPPLQLNKPRRSMVGQIPIFVLEESPEGAWKARHVDAHPKPPPHPPSASLGPAVNYTPRPTFVPRVSDPFSAVDVLEETSEAFSARSGPFPSPQFSSPVVKGV
eukprot:Hpha_TRINITY_DN14336_c0_g1::TRINITY_DN14336_c0_g1_i1::g.86976::m.86976